MSQKGDFSMKPKDMVRILINRINDIKGFKGTYGEVLSVHDGWVDVKCEHDGNAYVFDMHNVEPVEYAWGCDSEGGFYSGFNSVEEAISDIKEYDPTIKKAYIGIVEKWVPTVDEERVIESVVDSAYVEFDGLADGYLESVTAQDETMLGKMLTDTFNKWAERTKNEPHMFNVVEVNQYDVL